MSLLALAALLGTVLPLLIAVVQRAHWPNPARAAVAVMIAAVAALAVVVGQGDWHGLTQTTADSYGTAFGGLVVATWGLCAVAYLRQRHDRELAIGTRRTERRRPLAVSTD